MKPLFEKAVDEVIGEHKDEFDEFDNVVYNITFRLVCALIGQIPHDDVTEEKYFNQLQDSVRAYLGCNTNYNN